jgi:hypothetical protein
MLKKNVKELLLAETKVKRKAAITLDRIKIKNSPKAGELII